MSLTCIRCSGISKTAHRRERLRYFSPDTLFASHEFGVLCQLFRLGVVDKDGTVPLWDSASRSRFRTDLRPALRAKSAPKKCFSNCSACANRGPMSYFAPAVPRSPAFAKTSLLLAKTCALSFNHAFHSSTWPSNKPPSAAPPAGPNPPGSRLTTCAR